MWVAGRDGECFRVFFTLSRPTFFYFESVIDRIPLVMLIPIKFTP